jgi:formylglycine-generating enzyme required for sulfatase activity
LPIDSVTWWSATEWCERAGLRLPSEAEWEYACRAGSSSRWCFGDDRSRLAGYAWYRYNSGYRLLDEDTAWDPDELTPKYGCKTRAVALKSPNSWGIRDVHGNVSEWCRDEHRESYDGAPSDGSPREGSRLSPRVLRGGSWRLPARSLRCAWRIGLIPDLDFNTFGFRPAADLPPPENGDGD